MTLPDSALLEDLEDLCAQSFLLEMGQLEFLEQ